MHFEPVFCYEVFEGLDIDKSTAELLTGLIRSCNLVITGSLLQPCTRTSGKRNFSNLGDDTMFHLFNCSDEILDVVLSIKTKCSSAITVITTQSPDFNYKLYITELFNCKPSIDCVFGIHTSHFNEIIWCGDRTGFFYQKPYTSIFNA